MKTKLYWLTLIMSAAMAAQARAGGHQGGGGTFAAPAHGGGGFARGGAPSFQSAPFARFGGGRMMYSGQRFSAPGFRSPYLSSNGRAFTGTRQFNPGSINRGVTNSRTVANGRGQIRGGNNLPSNWRNHVVAQHSSNWHRDWDRGRDHWWHGHRCRFVNGSWFIFDVGFDPWLPYGYPYDYYAGDYYPYPYGYGYDYDPYQGEAYYDQNGYADQYADSTVASAQDQLAKQGYYRGAIDGVLGPETRRAIAQYQSNHGLRVTGALTTDTLQALGLPRVATS